jgi:DNA end-binding protein Ku
MAVTNTTLEVGLLAIPVGLHKADSANGISLSSASPAGHKVKQTYVDTETGEVIDRGDLQKGVWEGDTFHAVDAEAVAEIDQAGKLDSFKLEGFLPLTEVPFERATGFYFIGPQRGGVTPPKPLALLRDALKETASAGFFKLTLRTRQQPAVIYEKDGGLIVNTLAWGEDVKADPAEMITDEASDAAQLKLAVQLVKGLAGTRKDLDGLTDDTRPLKARLLEDALAGKQVKAPAKKAAAKKADTDLEALLKASVKAGKVPA